MKILFLSASPLTSARLDIELEAKAIRAAIAASTYREAITFIDESAVTPSDLVKLIDSVRPQILHFSGHGESEGIVLRDEFSDTHVIRGGSLQRVLENRGIELLVLNACGSDEHAQSALLSVKTVVGTIDAVEDRIALSFSTAFYEAIAGGMDVAAAFERAQRIVDANGGPRANYILRGDKALSFALANTPPRQPVPVEAPPAAGACRLRLSKRGLPGISHRLGSIHLHIDGAQATDLVRTTLAAHEKEGYTAEFSTVCDFVAGSQREIEPDLYAVHTPGQEAREELEFFSTTILFDGPDLPSQTQWNKIIGATRDSLVRLFDFERQREGRRRGVVLELERVVGDVGVDGVVAVARDVAIDIDGRRRLLDPEQLLFTPDYPHGGDADASIWYELHFSLDFPKRGGPPPLALERLNGLSQEAGLSVGGWFLFQDTERWAYRSNGFVDEPVSAESLGSAWRALAARLSAGDAGVGGDYKLRLLAEESLAVWKSPLIKSANGIMTLPELATWEGGVRPLSEFWVVAPNFLGDSDPAVAKAMLSNIGQGTRYVYFLRSSADARRWLSFKSAMAAHLGKDPRMDAYIVEFDDDFWAFNIAFIANPLAQAGEAREAVQLRTDGRSRRIIWGRQMPASEIELLCRRLQGGIRTGNVRRWEHVDGSGRSTRLAALCVRFAAPLSGIAVDNFDELLAEKVSANQGEVVEYGRTTVVVAFHLASGNVTAALRCAADLVGQLRKEGDTLGAKYGIDAGEAIGVVRANGTTWQGSALEGCKELIERHGKDANPEAILLSAEAAAMLDVGKDVWPDLKIEVEQGVHVGTVLAARESAALALVHVADTA